MGAQQSAALPGRSPAAEMEGSETMMPASRHTPIVAAIFAELLRTAQEPRASRWELTLRNTQVIARLEDTWLVMTAPAAGSASPPALLGWTAALPGRVKFALSARGEPQIRAEIPLDEDAGPLIREAWRGFETAL